MVAKDPSSVLLKKLLCFQKMNREVEYFKGGCHTNEMQQGGGGPLTRHWLSK